MWTHSSSLRLLIRRFGLARHRVLSLCLGRSLLCPMPFPSLIREPMENLILSLRQPFTTAQLRSHRGDHRFLVSYRIARLVNHLQENPSPFSSLLVPRHLCRFSERPTRGRSHWQKGRDICQGTSTLRRVLENRLNFQSNHNCLRVLYL